MTFTAELEKQAFEIRHYRKTIGYFGEGRRKIQAAAGELLQYFFCSSFFISYMIILYDSIIIYNMKNMNKRNIATSLCALCAPTPICIKIYMTPLQGWSISDPPPPPPQKKIYIYIYIYTRPAPHVPPTPICIKIYVTPLQGLFISDPPPSPSPPPPPPPKKMYPLRTPC